ncbi:MAG: type II toxin-antitoxin system VapC family toxin [Halolamina sp.]
MTILALDNSVASDLVAGMDYPGEFLETFPRDTDVVLPSIVWFEAMVPAFRSGDGRTVRETQSALGKLPLLEFGREAANETAEIRAELLDRGEPVGAPDVMIAGTARANNAAIVTTNANDFDRISELDVHGLLEDRQAETSDSR